MEAGWRVFIVWECAARRDGPAVVRQLADAILDPDSSEVVIAKCLANFLSVRKCR